MKFADIAGNELDEGTPVSFPLALGQAIQGNIVKAESGLGVGAEATPRLFVAFVVPLQVAPNGLVPGVMAMPPAPAERLKV